MTFLNQKIPWVWGLWKETDHWECRWIDKHDSRTQCRRGWKPTEFCRVYGYASGRWKRGSHGLFNERDEPIILNQAANEIAEHKGNVWSHVVSLRREDAVRLGFDNSDAWRELVKRHISNIAKTQNIPLCNWSGTPLTTILLIILISICLFIQQIQSKDFWQRRV